MIHNRPLPFNWCKLSGSDRPVFHLWPTRHGFEPCGYFLRERAHPLDAYGLLDVSGVAGSSVDRCFSRYSLASSIVFASSRPCFNFAIAASAAIALLAVDACPAQHASIPLIFCNVFQNAYTLPISNITNDTVVAPPSKQETRT